MHKWVHIHSNMTRVQYRTFLSDVCGGVRADWNVWWEEMNTFGSWFNYVFLSVLWLCSSPVQLTVGKRRKTGLLLERRSCSAPPRRATLPPFTASRTTSWRSPPQTATEYPTVTDRANPGQPSFFFIRNNLWQKKSAASFSMFFVCRKHKVIISGQKCKWYFIYWTLLNNLWTPFYIYINIYINF